MANCHLRSCVVKQTRILANRAFQGQPNKVLSSFVKPRTFYNASVASLHKDCNQQFGLNSNKRQSSVLLTVPQLLDNTQFRYLHFSQTVLYSNKATSQESNDVNYKTDSVKPVQSTDRKTENVPEEKLSIFQRFKKTYKEHGKVLVGVHLLTSTVWFGTFFYAAKVGVDVIPFMEWIGLPDKVINPFRNSSLGDIALAYLMYKLATPARYTVTLAGTNYAIKYLRKAGKMQPKDKSASLRVLAKDSRIELKKKRKEMKGKTSELGSKLKEGQVSLRSFAKDSEAELRRKRREMQGKTKEIRTKLKQRQLKVNDKVKDRIKKLRLKLNSQPRLKKKHGEQRNNLE